MVDDTRVRHAESRFSLTEGNELAHALTAHIGQAFGIGVLSIKGLVADRYALRPPRQAADADVIVEPSRFDEFCELLRRRGWHERAGREVPSLLGQHSVTLIHDSWPNDIDVHRFYPGFFADPAVVFDRLWESNVVIEVAHAPVHVPSRGGAAVIAALHALRFTRAPRHRSEAELIKAAAREFDVHDRAEFIDIARAGRAQWVLGEVLVEMGADVPADVTPTEQRLWTIHRETTEDGAAVSWLEAVHHASLIQKPIVLARALWISREDVPRNDPSRRPTIRETWTHRVTRWRRGVMALLHYARVRRSATARNTDPSVGA